MESLMQLVEKMYHLLDDLIKIANKIKSLSEKVVLEEELKPLQASQNDLLDQLVVLQTELQSYDPSLISSEIHAQFHKKLEEFQKLNQEFINNIKNSQGIIQFDFIPKAVSKSEHKPNTKF